jgi:hypothetical protein
LEQHGVPQAIAHHVSTLPPVSSLFASLLGVNPVQHLLAPSGVLSKLSVGAQKVLTGREFFPHLISGPFHHGLVIVFATSAALAVLAGIASLLRGGRVIGTTAASTTAASTQVAPELPAAEMPVG